MMNSASTEIDSWLVDGAVETGQQPGPDLWLANFDVARQVVFSKMGGYSKLFVRPEKFVKRFYHTLYPLLIEDWLINEDIQLYDSFCSISVQLDVRFQATFSYAKSQLEILSEINEHIKSTYHAIIIDLINNELLNLQDVSWVHTGLGDIEQSIALAVSEMLMLENIQSQSVCTMKASFAEFPDIQLGKEQIYLSVLKKNYNVSEQNREELFRQQQQEQQQKLQHKQIQLENLEKNAELERVRQAQDAENQTRFLLEQGQLRQEQFEIEARLHADKVQHENRLKDISLQAELEEKQQQAELIRLFEQQQQSEKITHQTLLKQQELDAEVEKYEKKQSRWLSVKAKKNKSQLKYKYQQEQMKFDMDVANRKHLQEEQLEMQEQNYKVTRNSDIYLRREIELLELDKKRLELQAEIKGGKMKRKDKE